MSSLNVIPHAAATGGMHLALHPDSFPAAIRLHDDGEDHFHELSDEEKDALSEFIWKSDNIELTTVGIDIGSSTSHLMFAKVHLQRKSKMLSSGYVVVNRTILWKSPILLTPFLPDNSIDAGRLNAFIQDAYRSAGLDGRRYRQRRGDPDRRSHQAQQRRSHRRTVRRRVRQIRVRLGRPSSGMHAGRARLRRGGDFAASRTAPCSTSISAAAPPNSR